MSYVLLGYGTTVGALGAYALRVVVRRRALSRQSGTAQ